MDDNKTKDEEVELDDEAEDSLTIEDTDVDELEHVVGEASSASCDSYELSMQLVDSGKTYTS